MNSKINNLYNINEDNNLDLYFSLKNKHGLEISKKDKEIFIQDAVKKLEPLLLDTDLILYPQSSSSFISEIVYKLNKKSILLKKRTLNEIKDKLTEINFSKQELQSQINRISKMGDTFKINKIKYNQRHRYIKYLFEDIEFDKNKKIAFIDDSYFSGSTFDAVKHLNNNIVGLFIFRNN